MSKDIWSTEKEGNTSILHYYAYSTIKHIEQSCRQHIHYIYGVYTYIIYIYIYNTHRWFVLKKTQGFPIFPDISADDFDTEVLDLRKNALEADVLLLPFLLFERFLQGWIGT